MRILTAALLVMATASGAAAESGTFLSPSIQLLDGLEPIKNAPSVVQLGSPAPKSEMVAEKPAAKPANTDPARLAPLPTVIRAGDLGDPFVRITPIKASFASGGSGASSSGGESSSPSSSDSSGTLKPE